MKQTAIEWLVNVVQSCIAPDYIPKEIINQAKTMEKEQIVDAFSEGTRMIDVNDEMSAMLNGFIYYNETYEQSEQG